MFSINTLRTERVFPPHSAKTLKRFFLVFVEDGGKTPSIGSVSIQCPVKKYWRKKTILVYVSSMLVFHYRWRKRKRRSKRKRKKPDDVVKFAHPVAIKIAHDYKLKIWIWHFSFFLELALRLCFLLILLVKTNFWNTTHLQVFALLHFAFVLGSLI